MQSDITGETERGDEHQLVVSPVGRLSNIVFLILMHGFIIFLAFLSG